MLGVRKTVLFSCVCAGFAVGGAFLIGGCADSATESNVPTGATAPNAAETAPKPAATIPPEVQVGPPK